MSAYHTLSSGQPDSLIRGVLIPRILACLRVIWSPPHGLGRRIAIPTMSRAAPGGGDVIPAAGGRVLPFRRSRVEQHPDMRRLCRVVAMLSCVTRARRATRTLSSAGTPRAVMPSVSAAPCASCRKRGTRNRRVSEGVKALESLKIPSGFSPLDPPSTYSADPYCSHTLNRLGVGGYGHPTAAR